VLDLVIFLPVINKLLLHLLWFYRLTACSLGLSATSQQHFSLRTNQPAVLFSQNKSALAISHQPNEQAVTPKCPNNNLFVSAKTLTSCFA
jgi:hypothetical protein